VTQDIKALKAFIKRHMYYDEIGVNKVDEQLAEANKNEEYENIVKILGNNYRKKVGEKFGVEIQGLATVGVQNVDSMESMEDLQQSDVIEFR